MEQHLIPRPRCAAANFLRTGQAVQSIAFCLAILQSTLILAATRPATPWSSPPAGTYTYGIAVKISDANSGAAVYYTTDGTTPTIQSKLYTGPISTPSTAVTETISAIAIQNGVSSWTMSAVYTIAPRLSPPTFFPAPGSYAGAQRVSISSPFSTGVIHYTIDGSTPTNSSLVYRTPILVSDTSSVIAVVAGTGYTASQLVRANYAITNPAPTPTISPASGSYSTSPTITITDSVKGASIYYTVNGAAPTAASTVYTSPFSLSSSGTVTIQAIATASGYQPSAVATATLKLAPPAGVLATSVVGGTPVVTIPTDFLGVSHEWNDAQTMMGSVSLGTNPLYRSLLSPLAQNMGGSLVVRVGGGSTDKSGSMSPQTVEPFKELASEMPVEFILGVNLGEDDLALAQEQAATIIANVPSTSLAGVEIGNEADQYGSNGLRPPGYSFPEFLADYQRWRGAILSLGKTGIAGPAFATDNWTGFAQGALTGGLLQADIVTQHEYVACYDKSKPEPNNFLLLPTSSTMHLYYLTPYAAAAHAEHLKFRVAEINSLCMGGQPGLSNSFSSSLWAIDTMFEYARAGVDGVNWNTSYEGGPYDLFQFHIWQKNGLNQYWLGTVRPLYYGLLFFSRAAGKNAGLLPVTTITNDNVKVWATKDKNGNAYLAIINKEQTLAGNVQVTLGGYSRGTVTRLSAPGGYLAATGVTFGGQTFDNSLDGGLMGLPTSETLAPTGNVWTVYVQPMSAVLVALEP